MKDNKRVIFTVSSCPIKFALVKGIIKEGLVSVPKVYLTIVALKPCILLARKDDVYRPYVDVHGVGHGNIQSFLHSCLYIYAMEF